MEEKEKTPKKKRAKKESGGVPKAFEALAELTSSDIVQQVKMGMSRIAPMETGDEPEFEEPTQ